MEDIKFGIPFYTYSIPDWETKKEVILNSLPDFKKYKLEKSKSSGHGDKNHYTDYFDNCLLYTSPSPRDRTRSRMPSSA